MPVCVKGRSPIIDRAFFQPWFPFAAVAARAVLDFPTSFGASVLDRQ
jgi:hypothetical protein